jgi:hypothetical protein
LKLGRKIGLEVADRRVKDRLVDTVASSKKASLADVLTALPHRGHTAEFWAALGRIMPDYESRRIRLREVGAALVW